MFHLEIYLCADDEVPLIVNTSLKQIGFLSQLFDSWRAFVEKFSSMY